MILDRRVPLVGAVAPAHAATCRVALVERRRARSRRLDFFDRKGFSLVAGRARRRARRRRSGGDGRSAARARARCRRALRQRRCPPGALRRSKTRRRRSSSCRRRTRSSCSPRSGRARRRRLGRRRRGDDREHRSRRRRGFLVAGPRLRRSRQAEHRRAWRLRSPPPSPGSARGRVAAVRDGQRHERRRGDGRRRRGAARADAARRSTAAASRGLLAGYAQRGRALADRGRRRARSGSGRPRSASSRPIAATLGFGIWRGRALARDADRDGPQRLEPPPGGVAERDRRRRLRGAQVHGRARASSSSAPGARARVKVTVRAPPPPRAPVVTGNDRSAAAGSDTLHVPWALRSAARRRTCSAARRSAPRSFAPSDTTRRC